MSATSAVPKFVSRRSRNADPYSRGSNTEYLNAVKSPHKPKELTQNQTMLDVNTQHIEPLDRLSAQHLHKMTKLRDLAKAFENAKSRGYSIEPQRQNKDN